MKLDKLLSSKLVLILVLLNILKFKTVRCEKILFLLPIASKSHSNVFEPLISALFKRGHDLTIISPSPFKNLETNKNSSITQFSPLSYEDIMPLFGGSGNKNGFELRKLGRVKSFAGFDFNYLLSICAKAVQNPNFAQLVDKKQGYDLVIINGLLNECFTASVYKLGVPFIFLTTLAAPSYVTEKTGNYLPSSTVPLPFLELTGNMGFYERTLNFFANAWIRVGLHVYYIENFYEKFYRENYGDGLPGYYEMYENLSLVLSNSHFSLTYPRPNFPDNVEVGGMHCRDPLPLPKDIDEFLSGAEEGFIYFSLGSIVQAHEMPQEYRNIFLNVFSKLRQRVIWKWEGEMVDLPENVKISKWLPQQDILGHPNIKVFITHGGLLSTQEAVYHGVPILGIPIFADQDLNMIQAESQGYALRQEILNLTAEDFERKLKRLIEEPEFRLKAKKLSKIYRDQTETPTERAVYWSEYILRHKGAKHLRSAARQLNYFQIHSYDVIGFILLIFIILLLILKITINIFFSSIRWILHKHNNKDENCKKCK